MSRRQRWQLDYAKRRRNAQLARDRQLAAEARRYRRHYDRRTTTTTKENYA
jgi:hypothetical protein